MAKAERRGSRRALVCLSRRFSRWAACLCLSLLPCLVFAQATQAVPAAQPASQHGVQARNAPIRIGVITMLPGTIFWERFGHDAIVVDDPALPEPISYNFGFFDLDEPGFVRRFIQGDMQYQLLALPLSQDLAYYRQVGRGVQLQWLDFTPAQAQHLARDLAFNALPQNARYRYDYFTDNCATRVRDALDRALDGALQRRWQATSQGNTYRGEAVRLASPATWMALGFDVGLGPAADRPLTRWQDAFVPMHLAQLLRETRLADGRPLVLAETTLLPHQLPAEPAAQRRWWWAWLAAGIAIGAGLLALQRRHPAAVAAFAAVFWLLCGVLGVLMLYLWLGTEHRFGWANRNALLLNPLCLLLLPAVPALLRNRRPRAWFTWLLRIVAACVIAAILVLWLSIGDAQRNAHWVALLAPIHFALAMSWAFARKPLAPP